MFLVFKVHEDVSTHTSTNLDTLSNNYLTTVIFITLRSLSVLTLQR